MHTRKCIFESNTIIFLFFFFFFLLLETIYNYLKYTSFPLRSNVEFIGITEYLEPVFILFPLS